MKNPFGNHEDKKRIRDEGEAKMKSLKNVFRRSFAGALTFGLFCVQTCCAEIWVSGQRVADADAPVVRGEWHGGFESCLAEANRTHTPLVAVFSSEWGGCPYCVKFKEAANTDLFREWMKDSGCLFLYMACDYPNNENMVRGNGYSGFDSDAWKWIQAGGGSVNSLGSIRVYWNVDDKKVLTTAFTYTASRVDSDEKTREKTETMIRKCEDCLTYNLTLSNDVHRVVTYGGFGGSEEIVTVYTYVWVTGVKDDTVSVVRIPRYATHIGPGAFANMWDLDNVVIPDGIETIGECAFENCSLMQTIKFGKGLKKIGKNAFKGCTQLQKVVFQDGLCEIEDGAFDGCWRLQSVSLPVSVSNVAETAFTGCSGLKGVTTPTHCGKMSSWFKPIYTQIRDVTIAAGELKVGDGMFAGCSALENVAFADSKDGVRTIGNCAFQDCVKLSGLTLPESLSEVGSSAFKGCTTLTAIVLPSGVSWIGSSVFENCSALKDVTLSQSLSAIPDRAFYGCDSLDSFTVPESVSYLGSQIVSGSSSWYSSRGTSAIYFLGDAPSYADDVYGAARSDLTSYIVYGTRGWDGRVMSRDIPQQWPTDTAAQRNILTWSPNPFDVTFDAAGGLFVNDGSTIYACQQITYAAYALPPYNPMRSGYIFNGWWTERTGGTQVTPSVRVVLTKAHTLYAHWTAAGEIRVRFNATGGTVIPEDGSYLSAAPFGEMPVPTMEYWDFDGWWTQPSGGTRVTEASEVPAADVELFAHWVPARYKIIFHAENGSSYDTTRTQTFTYGETVTLDRNRWSCASATFGGWALEPGGRAVYADEKVLTDLSAIRNGELHLYAVWIGDTYAVRFDSNGGVGRMNDQTMVIGVSYNLHTNCFTRANYTFQGWAEKANGSKKYADGARIYNGFAAAKGDTVVLYAVWRKITSHSVTYDANGGVCTTVKRTYSTATVGSIPTATRTGYAFLGWYTAKQGGEKLTVETILPASVTYFARWAPIRGIVGIVSPYPLEARAGRTVRFAFAREGDVRGSIAVKVKTQTSTALIGTGPENGDLLYVKQILEWADGDTSDKYIDVPIYGTGIGKQFRFKLATMATGTYDGNVVPALEEAKIYVPIVGATPGMIALTRPDPLEAHENTICRVRFSRIGGSDGEIAVKVKSQTSTATLRSATTLWGQVGYVKEILEWGPGDTSDRYVDVPIYSNGAGLMFRLKLATMATGVYQGNLVPKLEEAKIYVPIVR